MPPRTPRLKLPRHAVTAVLVSHDGARWLPETLAAIAALTRPPQQIVAVDTGSVDESRALLSAALGPSAVLERPRDASLGAAIQAGLDAFVGAPSPPQVRGEPVEWLWILHDDCAPDPDALEQLLVRAEESPSATVIGPKALSWNRHRLLEVGITIDGSGLRETGLEQRELDQGQHDSVTDVLAVGTAGMLVRRDEWDRVGGLDELFAVYGDDLDFGWRVHAAGGRVMVAPAAVVRHAAALSAGTRGPDAVHGRPASIARAHGMSVVLVNTSPGLVPYYLLRFVAESLLRAALLLVLLRQPSKASAEIGGLRMLLAHPGRVLAGRRRRRAGRTRGHAEIRPFLARPGLRLRHFSDTLAEAVAGRTVADERRRRRAPIETGPVAEETESFEVDDLGVVQRFVRRPGVALAIVATVAAVIAYRSLLGGALHGGRLLPWPGGASGLWSAYTSGWHPVGLGSNAAAPPALAVLALFSTLLLGKVWLAVDLLVIGAVPLAAVTGYIGAGALCRTRRIRVAAAAAYALLPATAGAVAGGRIDVTFAGILLPLVARAAAAAVRVNPHRHGWHRSAGAGLVLALAVGLAPIVWPVAVVALVVAAASVPDDGRRWRVAGALALLAVPLVVWLPWTWHLVSDPSLAVRGLGLPEPLATVRPVSPLHLLLLHPDGPGQAVFWFAAPIVIAALVGAALPERRLVGRAALTCFVAGVALAVAVSRAADVTPGSPGSRYWTGAALLAAGLGALIAATIAAEDAPERLRSSTFSWRQPAAAVLAVAAILGLGAQAVAWVRNAGVGGAGEVRSGTANVLPVFAQAETAAPTLPRSLALVLDGDVVHYTVLRRPSGLLLGDADLVPAAGTSKTARAALDRAVRDLAAGRPISAGELAEFGLALVVVSRDDTGGLNRIADVPGMARVPATTTVVYRAPIPAGECSILAPADATVVRAGGLLPSLSRPTLVNAAAAGAVRADVASGPAGRMVVLAEPASSHWTARLDGRVLTRSVAYGWAQAWELPSSGGRLVVTRSGDDRNWWMVGELIALALLLVLTLPTHRLVSREVAA